MRPTHASPIYKDNVPDADDPNVALLRDAGAAVFAKTNLPEFGAGANTVNRVFGATGGRPRWFSGIAQEARTRSSASVSVRISPRASPMSGAERGTRENSHA